MSAQDSVLNTGPLRISNNINVERVQIIYASEQRGQDGVVRTQRKRLLHVKHSLMCLNAISGASLMLEFKAPSKANSCINVNQFEITKNT